MAKAKSGGESKIGLIIALAFFVITSIALGVFAYQFNSDIETANEKAKKAKETETKATDLLNAERRRVAMYKAFVGAELSTDEKTVLAGVPSTDPLRAEQQALMARVKAGLQSVAAAEGMGYDPNDFIVWDWADGKSLPEAPKTGSRVVPARNTTLTQESLRLVSAAEKIRIQAVAAKANYDAAIAAFNTAKTEYETAKGALDTARQQTVAEKDAVVKTVAQAKDDAKKTYEGEAAGFRDQLNKLNQAKNKAEVEKQDLADAVKLKQDQLAAAVKEIEAKNMRDNPLPTDLPKGRIVSRKGNVVEINLGSADKLQAGVTFSVQPLDYPEKGVQSRLRQVYDEKGRPVRDREGKAVKNFQPKGSVEVIDVLGPNLARAQIKGEYDDIREPLMEEDLLYHASWNRGVTDHVVLVGVFDKDGNGTDDIKQVAAELKKAGILVDAYWDLATGKWADGAPTERTAYAIRGEAPAIVSGSGVRDSISLGMGEAYRKGAKVISYRDYFPRVGYKVALGVTDDAVNQAAAKYMQAAPPIVPTPEVPK